MFGGDVIKSKVLGQSVAFIIIAVNIVLKMATVKGITWVGEDTNSQQLGSITNGVFVAQFFNTGILILLVNGNMSEHSPQFFTKFIQGPFYDYMPQWYVDVGYKIVQTMLIQSIMPYVTLTTSFVIPMLMRGLDSKFSFNPYKTKKTAMGVYRDLYSGKDYLVHAKYSSVLNIVYVTMMYGIGMPILFPIAAFNFMNQYICERIIVAYTMKLPPALDDQLTKNCIDMMKYAPLFMLFNAYWMLSNVQIFSNETSIIHNTLERMKSGHIFKAEVNWASPVLFMVLCAVILQIVQRLFQDYLNKFGFGMQSKEIAVDEDLPDFLTTVKLSQA